jgi:hypothetical protein
MTLKTVVDSAAIRVIGNAPAAVMASQEQIAIEMRDLVNDVAVSIAESYDWRDLTKLAEFVGDGVQTAFPIPSDYDRMTVNNGIRDMKNWFWGYFPFDSVNDYLMMKSNGFSLLSPGGWIILNEKFNFVPAPHGTAEFPYISSNIVQANSGTLKPSFTADDDEFVLSERLLTLGLIWRYKAQKGLDYTEDLATYEEDLSQKQTRDRGQRSVRHGMTNTWSRSRVAWPWPLG